MKTLPLFYFPSTYVWVDDDKNLLDTLVLGFNQKNRFKKFSSSIDCKNFFADYKAPLAANHFLQGDHTDENYGLPSKMPLNFDVTQIAQLSENQNRFDEISVMISDYHMPVLNGFELAKTLEASPVQKILLTGNLEERKAIEGFNKHLIQKFVRKASAEMCANLTEYLKELSTAYFEQITKPMVAYLESENKTALSDAVFIDFFEEFCKANRIAEFYLIDKQGSFLCVDEQGKKSIVVVHTQKSLEEFLSVYTEDSDFIKKNLDAIQHGTLIPFFGIAKEAWQAPIAEWEKYFHAAESMQGREKYFWCKVDC